MRNVKSDPNNGSQSLAPDKQVRHLIEVNDVSQLLSVTRRQGCSSPGAVVALQSRRETIHPEISAPRAGWLAAVPATTRTQHASVSWRISWLGPSAMRKHPVCMACLGCKAPMRCATSVACDTPLCCQVAHFLWRGLDTRNSKELTTTSLKQNAGHRLEHEKSTWSR